MVRRPVVAIVATGDELVDIATEPAPGQVVDSSAHALAVQIAMAGGVPRASASPAIALRRCGR
ncbi:MAG: hypothetical protein HS111_29085 [Kofleriaceae bacterium]|nr:hypothetical protein [Kofleriaceae bacterium]